ncbi:hypothetical protein ACIHCX_36710 [Streptomyces sp. NPDC052043]|uniref:hypothetical protein n=1 Tax=Streptomyces sp. NPDC052043 TaxID=3365684 RepID=UPI0037D50DD7
MAVLLTGAGSGVGLDVVRAGAGLGDALREGLAEGLAGELADVFGVVEAPAGGSVPAAAGFTDAAPSSAGPHALAATATVRLAAASSRGLRRFFMEYPFIAGRSVPSLGREASHTYITKSRLVMDGCRG